MITYSDLGKKGRLGNQLFQIASTIGIAMSNEVDCGFPDWDYDFFFKNDIPKSLGVIAPNLKEANYHYDEVKTTNANMQGWLQSETYWINHKKEILKQFEFKDELTNIVNSKMPLPDRKTIAISIRRGDFVNNPNYIQLPITYYILALTNHFPDYLDYNIVFFSDDINYCKVHFECLPNAFFADKLTSIEQLCLMSMCDHFIISNSTFSWWGAYLGTKQGTKVIRPYKNMTGTLAGNDEKDYWLDSWITFDHRNKKIDLSKFTFTIPVFHDHVDRRKNFDLAVQHLERYFDTNILIGEQGSDVFKSYPNYIKFNYKEFHRTKMLNEMALAAKTPYVVNFDCDILVPPMQFILALQALENGADFVYPYDGRFARVPRQEWLTPLQNYIDIGIVAGTQFKGKNGTPLPISSVGGVVVVNRESFIESGMENEFMISYCPEDCERWDRWHTLGYKVVRIGGTVYHLDHFIGINSGSRNPFWKAGHDLLDKIRLMSKEDLRIFVDSWEWKIKNQQLTNV